jgi:hypothetical protein
MGARLLPRTLNIANRKRESSKLDVAGYGIGDRYARMASEALRHSDLQTLESVRASNNNFRSPKQLELFLNSLPRALVKLDLS